MGKRKEKELEVPLNVVKGDFNSDANDTGLLSLANWYLKKVGNYTDAVAALEAANESKNVLRRVRARMRKESKGQETLFDGQPCSGCGKVTCECS